MYSVFSSLTSNPTFSAKFKNFPQKHFTSSSVFHNTTISSSTLVKRSMFKFPNTITSLVLVSLIIFSDIKFNSIGDNASTCLQLIITLAGFDVFYVHFTLIFIFFYDGHLN